MFNHDKAMLVKWRKTHDDGQVFPIGWWASHGLSSDQPYLIDWRQVALRAATAAGVAAAATARVLRAERKKRETEKRFNLWKTHVWAMVGTMHDSEWKNHKLECVGEQLQSKRIQPMGKDDENHPIHIK